MRLLILATLAASGISYEFMRPVRAERPPRAGGRHATLGVSAAIPVVNPYLVFAPLDGGGLPVAQDLCAALEAGDKVDNWWCLNGDETTSGVVSLTEVGTVTPTEHATCPNGSNCDTVSGFLTSNTKFYKTPASTASPAGDFTVCGLGVFSAGAGMVADKATGGTDIVFRFYGNTTATQGQVCKAAASCTTVNSPAITSAGERHFACLVYDYVADGSSVLRAWVDGVGGTASTTAVGPPLSNTVRATIGINGLDESSDRWNGPLEGVFYTESALSDARIAALARAVLADAPVAGLWDGGTLPLTFTRASTKFCDNGSGEGSMLPANRPCITQGGLSVEGARTNTVLRSEEFDNAAWIPYKDVAGVLPVVTANQATAPNGTLTADKIDFSVTGAGDSSIVYQPSVLSAAPWAFTLYVKGVSGSGTIDMCIGTTSCGACAYTNTSWTRCTRSATASGTLSLFFGNASLYNGGTTRAAQSVYVWGAQTEQASYPTSYTATTSASATRAVETAYFDTGATTPLTGDNMTLSAEFVALPATTTDNYPSLLKVASDSSASNSGKGMWLYSPNSYGATFRCLTVNEAGGDFSTGTAASVGGNVRGWCSSVDSGVVYGGFGGTVLTDSASTSGTFGPARYVILAGSALASPDAIKKDICLTQYQIDAGVCAP